MSAAAMLAGAAPGPAVDWHSIDWKKAHGNVRRLQARIVQVVIGLNVRRNQPQSSNFGFNGRSRTMIGFPMSLFCEYTVP